MKIIGGVTKKKLLESLVVESKEIIEICSVRLSTRNDNYSVNFLSWLLAKGIERNLHKATSLRTIKYIYPLGFYSSSSDVNNVDVAITFAAVAAAMMDIFSCFVSSNNYLMRALEIKYHYGENWN